jgi:hypothetical protein
MRDEVLKMLHKNYTTISHAKKAPIGRDKAIALCGYTGEDTSYYAGQQLKAVFAGYEWEVDCRACKGHKQWHLWVVNKISVSR